MIPSCGDAPVRNNTNMNVKDTSNDKILFEKAMGYKKSLKEPLLLSPNSNDCDYKTNFESMKY